MRLRFNNINAFHIASREYQEVAMRLHFHHETTVMVEHFILFLGWKQTTLYHASSVVTGRVLHENGDKANAVHAEYNIIELIVGTTRHPSPGDDNNLTFNRGLEKYHNTPLKNNDMLNLDPETF